ncbi:MAG: amidohydrolase [Alphaproteobacteria bacterium]|nr:amidohydrolase [Alphaproteobacteria bacterium]|tara:strand:- start:1117 stop:1956 length:840 start_codon:yes stop_codon:yes gene_type:complete
MIIDFRLRPPIKEYAETQMFALDTIEVHARLFGTIPPDGPPSARERSVQALISEMDEAGVSVGVSCGRHRPGTGIPSSALKRLADEYPGRFVPLASVDVLDAVRAKEMIDEGVGGYDFPGIHIDLGALGMAPDDPRMAPIYDHCDRLDAIVAINTSAFGAQEQSLCNPESLDRAARDFPNVNFVSSHGSYPYVLQIIGVAAKRPNVYISPDVYMSNMPGGHMYVEAANSFLQDKVLFGSAYPYSSVGDIVSRYKKLPLSEEALEKIFWRNAHRLLNLGD